jgi:hypothetical protein
MTDNVKLTSGKGSMEARIAARLRGSNDHATADHHVVSGSGPTRASHTIHRSGGQGTHSDGGPLSHDEEQE